MKQSEYNQADSLGRIIHHSNRALSNRLQRNFCEAGYEVTVEQWRILISLDARDGQNQQELSESTGKDKTGITRIIDGLEKRNLVVRIPNRADGRQKLVYLTPKSKRMQKGLIAVVQKTLSEAQEGIPERHLEICKDVLVAVIENIRN